MADNNFTWIPFYTELAEKLLEYKDKRKELIDFIFSEDGLREFSDYLHLEDKEQKIDDIDPFSFMGMFNRGKQKTDNRIIIVKRIKEFFQIKADVPTDFDGIPVLNYQRMFYYHWSKIKDSCDKMWAAYDLMMKGNLSHWFNYCEFPKRKAECTMPLFWCNAKEYIALDSRNLEYLRNLGFDVNVTNIESYLALIQEIKNKMSIGELKEKSFVEISYNAWNMSKENENISFWSGGVKWDDGKTNMIDEFNSQKSWQIGWRKEEKTKGAKQAWDNIKKVKVGDYLAFHGYGGKNDLTIYQISQVTEVDENTGKIYFDRLSQEDDKLYRGKAPKMSNGSWFGTLFPVQGKEAIEKIFGDFLKQETNTNDCIIANITWNSNDWKGISDDKSGHKWVQEKGNIAHESWNFDFDNKRNPYDRIYGFVQFTNPPKNFKNKKYLVVFRSDNKIVGFYGNATICDYKEINSNESYNMIGDKSLSLLLENKIDDSSKDLLFGKERVGQIGFNYITIENALQILSRAKELNPLEGKIDKIKDWLTKNEGINQTIQNMIPLEIQQYTKLLKLKKNIILQGAPGTGKTYNTAALALSICGVTDVDLNDHKAVMERYEQMRYDKDKNPDGQIGFCTFHQSMDYEDFVEGIKPIKPDEGEMYYKVEDGIFKIMSRVATNPQQVIQAKTLDSAFDDLIQDIIDANVKNLPMKNGSSSADLSVSSQMTIKWKTGNGNIDVNCVSKDRLLKLCEVYDSAEKIGAIANINESIRNVIGGCNSSYYWAVANYILKKIDKGTVSDEKPQNYVLIIDEINRGNVSRIFGELITLLEKDKRLGGEHPIKVTLPYSKESFGVPENLYIIGTMNTTDRSVGNIDYAVRRRFAFATLQSQRDLVVTHSTEKAAVLFDAVKSFVEKTKTEMDFEDLMVGHSYFFAKDDEELALRWQYEILPLLNEYIKDDILRADRLESNMSVEKFVEKWNAESNAQSETEQSE